MAKIETYQECLDVMYALRRFGIKLGLSVIRNILDALGNPHDRYACVHVAGSNGKGSIASTLAAILGKSGHRVGLYTSPHLVRFNERIQIDHHPVSDDDVVSAYNAVAEVHQGDREPTFFEFTTAMALKIFADHEVDWAIIETGLGGRLDATNIIEPQLAIITNISLEHQMYLGNTIAQIAAEKAGIIKEGVPVICGAKQKSAIAVIQKRARSRRASFYRLGRDFRVRKNPSGGFTYFGIRHTWRRLSTALQGDFQIRNAALGLAACEILMTKGVEVPLSAIEYGVAHNRWPGRLEVVATDPMVILDGAHNLAASKALAGFLASRMAGKRITLVVGILDDKPYADMLQALVPVSSRVILTQATIDRSLPPDVMLPIVKPLQPDVVMIAPVSDAITHAMKTAGGDELICIAGSLYVVGEAKAHFERSHHFAV